MGLSMECEDHHTTRKAIEAMKHKALKPGDLGDPMAHDPVGGLWFSSRNAEPSRGLVEHEKICALMKDYGKFTHDSPSLSLLREPVKFAKVFP